MIQIKKMCLKLFLILEMAIFGYMYFFGNNGIYVLQEKRKCTMNLEKNIKGLKDEIEQLEQEIYVWQTDDFYKEKIAREQLQMARKGDELFYIG